MGVFEEKERVSEFEKSIESTRESLLLFKRLLLDQEIERKREHTKVRVNQKLLGNVGRKRWLPLPQEKRFLNMTTRGSCTLS